MQRPIKPEWLLRQANELGGRGAGQGQPRNADLRRAVSAAYYALFHEIVIRVTEHLLPQHKVEDRWEAGRRVSHACIRNVCAWVASGKTAPQKVRASVGVLQQNQNLVDVCDAYQELYEARNRADYDHTASFSKPTTLAHVDLSEAAIQLLAVESGKPDYQRLMAHIATGMDMT